MSNQELAQRDNASTANRRESQTDSLSTDTRALIPLVDVTEDESGITLTADLPGASRETLSLDVDGDTLKVGNISLL